jgi:outer membrane protein
MKNSKKIFYLVAAFLLCSSTPRDLGAQNPSGKISIGVVNFKDCVEKSKLGKQEQANFETLKKQMESVLEEKEKLINEVSNKLNDPDYLDSLSNEAEAELKHKFRTLNQELSQHQQQFYQMLNQANFKVIQKITDEIGKASKTVAANKGLDLIVNEEGTFFYGTALDVSNDVIKVLDEMLANEEKK